MRAKTASYSECLDVFMSVSRPWRHNARDPPRQQTEVV
jgi:hypothetical protein